MTQAAMTPTATWSIKGVSPDTRDAVKEAARHAGMTIAQWLNKTLPETIARKTPPTTPSGKDERWAEIAHHLSRMARRDSATTPPPTVHPASLRDIEALIDQASQKAGQRSREQAERLAEALSNLARYLQRSRERQEEEAGLAQDHALRQEQSTAKLAEAVSGLARHLMAVEQRLHTMPEDMAHDISTTVADAVSSRLSIQLDSKLAQVMPQPIVAADTSLQEPESHLAAMEQRLNSRMNDILSHLQDNAAASQEEPSVVGLQERLATAIADIRARQVELARIEAGEDNGEASPQIILERLESLSHKLDKALASPTDILTTEGASSFALGDVMSRLDKIDAHLKSIHPEAIARLEETVQRLAANIELSPADIMHGNLETLALQVSQLAEQIDSLTRGNHKLAGNVSAGPEHLATIEALMGDLAERLRSLPGLSDAALEQLAATAAREALAALPPTHSADERLEALRQDLAGLRTMQEKAEHRSGDALEAVHSTLEKVIDRLAFLEEDLGEHNFHAGAIEEPEKRAAEALTRAGDYSAMETAPSSSTQPMSSAEKRDDLNQNIGITASFIAAARRAAMAAAEETRTHARQTSPSATDGNPADEPRDTSPQDRRRPLLIGLGALIAAIGAAQIAASFTQQTATSDTFRRLTFAAETIYTGHAPWEGNVFQS